MPPHLTGEAAPPPRSRLGAWLRTRTLVQWVLAAMFAVGVLAFIRAFAGGEGVAAQRLAWGSLAWTFPLLWDLTAVIGSTLWIAAPRGTAAFRWGVFLNLTATVVSGLATGSQAYTLARDQVPQGWPVPGFVAGAAVPLLYSILTWAAASARDALADRSAPWTSPAAGEDPATRTPPPTTTGAASTPPLTTPSTAAPALPGSATPSATPLPAASTSSPTPPSWTDPDPTGPVSTPEPSPATASTPTATAPTPSTSASPPTGPPTPSSPDGSEAPTPAPPTTSSTGGEEAPAASGGAQSSPAPTGASGATPAPSRSGGPRELAASTSEASTASASPASSAPTSSSPTSSPDRPSPEDRREWATAELYRRQADGGPDLRPRDIDAHFGTTDGWRVLPVARDRVAAERQPVAAPSGMES